MTTTPKFVQKHLDVFLNTDYVKQGALGYSPMEWAKRIGITPLPDNISSEKMTRSELMEICQGEHPSEFKYACVMAWGQQGANPVTKPGALSAWQERAKWEALVAQHNGSDNRAEAYNNYRKANIKGLGPSYFTKLIAFMARRGDCYIMDQWTARSVNLLTGREVVRMTNNTPSKQNNGNNYEQFCLVVDELAKIRNQTGTSNFSGFQIEEMLFSQGAIRKGNIPRKPWRSYVINSD